MLAVNSQVSPPPAPHVGLISARSMPDVTFRRLFSEEEEESETTASLPSVGELLEEVAKLQAAVQQLEPRGAGDNDDFDLLCGTVAPGDRSMRSRISNNTVHAELRRRQSSFTSDLNTSFSSDSGAPPRPTTGRYSAPRVAALTKENISLLRAPLDHRRSANYTGSVCGSQKSRTSVRTDGGAVFSRLYQPDFYKTRDAKLKAIRDRQESFNLSLIPKINNRSSVCSRDSASSSVGSMMSAKTDVLNVSSRLYDPEYMRKRTAKLQKMREERELRSCTFAPTINTSHASSFRRTSNAVPPRNNEIESKKHRMTRKKPFSGKAKKQQLQEKRDRNRNRDGLWQADDEVGADEQKDEREASAPVTSGRGDLRTIFQLEPKSAVEARKRDATRLLVYAADRGNSQAIYEYGIHDPNNQLPILTKPKWTHEMTTEELVEQEEQAYKEWVERLSLVQEERGLPGNLYERNIEVWRQLWRTIERSDVVVHLADARCPVLHISDQLIQHILSSHPAKRFVLVLTKADIVPAARVAEWEAFIAQRYGDRIPVFPYNRELGDEMNTELLRLIGDVSRDINFAEREVVRQEDEETLTIGFVGEPNVGKSSLLNALFERKLVSVSATPGHTKHLQTHFFPHTELLSCDRLVKSVVVCDCPGVVFPRLNVPVALQILFGSFPIAQTREPFSAVRFIAENCDPPMDELYKLKPVEVADDEWSPYTLCESYAKRRGFHIRGGKFDLHRGANEILRDTLNGKKVVLSFPPPTTM